MNKIQTWLKAYWSVILIITIALLGVVSLLWFRIVFIPVGYSGEEWFIRNNLVNHQYSILYIWHHISFAPYNLLLIIPQELNRYGLFSIRSVGAIFGLISVGIFFYIIWRWWGNLIAILSTFIFLCSFWFLQSARNSGPEIIYILAGLLVVLLGFVVRNQKRHETKTLVSALIALILLYIPGMIWFLLVACILQRKLVTKEFKALPTQVKLIISITAFIFLIPLLHASYKDINQLKFILGLTCSIFYPCIYYKFISLVLNYFYT